MLISEWMLGIWASLWGEIQALLPNLLMLAVIAILTRLALNGMGFFYDAIGGERFG